MTLAEAIKRGRESWQQRTRLVLWMLYRLNVVPEVPGCRVFWNGRCHLEIVPFQSCMAPGTLTFGSTVNVPITNGPHALMIGDTMKVTLYEDNLESNV